MRTCYVVILVERGVVDWDGVKVFLTEKAAMENLLEIATDMWKAEPDSFKWDAYALAASSEHFYATIFEKEEV